MRLTEEQVSAGIAKYGPQKTLEAHLLINNSKILTSADAWEIVQERTTIMDALIKHQLRSTAQKVIGYDPVEKGEFPFRFGFFAVGGYGRGELSPNSDVDVRLVIDSPSPKGNPLASEYAHDATYTFPDKYGLLIDTQVHNLSDIQGFMPRDLNAFLDMRLLYGEGDLLPDIRAALRQQGNLSGLFLHNWRLLEELKAKHPQSFEEVQEFNIKYGIGGLRHYHAALWLEAAKSFKGSKELSTHKNLGESTRNSVGMLLKTRAWLNLERILAGTPDIEKRAGTLLRGSHSNKADTLKFSDFQELGPSAREKLLAARREICRFAESQMKASLWKGHPLTPDLLLTYEGLHIRPKSIRKAGKNPTEKTHAFFDLVRTAQMNGLTINNAVQPHFYAGAHQWIRPDPLFGRLFYDSGLRSKSLRYLANRYVLQKILPGFASLEASMHSHEHRAHYLTRAGFALQKIETRERLTGEQSPAPQINQEYTLLSPDDAAAVDLALLIKHIPKSSASRGVTHHTLSEYLELMKDLSFSTETLETAHFLVEAHPLVSYEALSRSLNTPLRVNELAAIAQSPQRLRSLYIFAHSDYGLIDGKDFPLWNDLRELYQKTMNVLEGKPEEAAYEVNRFDQLGRDLLEDLGPDFRSGRYRDTVNFWISALSKVQKSGNSIVQPFSHQDNMIGVACQDYRGLLAVITGALYKSGADVTQVHAYSLSQHHLALDMFEYASREKPKVDITQRIKSAIDSKNMINEDPSHILSMAQRTVSIHYHPESFSPEAHHYTLEYRAAQNVPGTMYALTRILYERGQASIYGVNAYAYPGRPVSNYVFFSSPLNSEELTPIIKSQITGSA